MTNKKLKDIPILAIGKTKNAGMEITERVFDDVLYTYDTGIHEAPIVAEPHADRFAGLKTRAGEALGWIKKLARKVINGKEWIVISELKPTSELHEQELLRLLSGPMKYNSLEADLGSALQTELYDDKKTSVWPDSVRNRFYLRRVNLLGADVPAQFSMPQAAFSDAQGVLVLSDDHEGVTYPTIKVEPKQSDTGGITSMAELNKAQDGFLKSIATENKLDLSKQSQLVQAHEIGSITNRSLHTYLFSEQTRQQILQKEVERRERERMGGN